MTIPEIIKHYRGSTTLREFASQLGVTHSAVQQWENGATEPKDEYISQFVNDSRQWVRDMGKALFIARNGSTLKTIIDNEKNEKDEKQ